MTGEPPNPARFCAAPPEPARLRGASGRRVAMLSEAFWGRDKQLSIGFFGGSQALRERVRDIAMEWIDRTGARLKLAFWTAAEETATGADIRIAFDPDQGSWSWVGKQAERIPAGEPTMNLGWMTLELEESKARAVVLHEFGHALGLIHEHLHPLRDIQWERQQVIDDLKASQGWDEATIAANMFDAPPLDATFATALDPHSIMMYPIPAHWTRNGFTTGWNADLTADDIRLIRAAYGERRSWTS